MREGGGEWEIIISWHAQIPVHVRMPYNYHTHKQRPCPNAQEIYQTEEVVGRTLHVVNIKERRPIDFTTNKVMTNEHLEPHQETENREAFKDLMQRKWKNHEFG